MLVSHTGSLEGDVFLIPGTARRAALCLQHYLRLLTLLVHIESRQQCSLSHRISIQTWSVTCSPCPNVLIHKLYSLGFTRISTLSRLTSNVLNASQCTIPMFVSQRHHESDEQWQFISFQVVLLVTLVTSLRDSIRRVGKVMLCYEAKLVKWIFKWIRTSRLHFQ